MRERAEFYGGTLDAGPCPDGGFLVTAVLPYGAAAGRQAGDGAGHPPGDETGHPPGDGTADRAGGAAAPAGGAQ